METNELSQEAIEEAYDIADRINLSNDDVLYAIQEYIKHEFLNHASHEFGEAVRFTEEADAIWNAAIQVAYERWAG